MPRKQPQEDVEKGIPGGGKRKGPKVETRLKCPKEIGRRPVQLVHRARGRDQQGINRERAGKGQILRSLKATTRSLNINYNVIWSDWCFKSILASMKKDHGARRGNETGPLLSIFLIRQENENLQHSGVKDTALSKITNP